MPSGQPGVLGGNWAGLRRDLAPYALGDESPATTDAALYNDIANVLGARRGTVRRYNTGNSIVGVVPFNFPFGQGRIIATSDGTWLAVFAPAAPGPSPAPLSGTATPLSTAVCSAGACTTTTKTWTFTAGLLQSIV